MKEERTAGPLHSAHSIQLHSPRRSAPPPPFFALVLLLFTLSWRLLSGVSATFHQGIISTLWALSGPSEEQWSRVQPSSPASCFVSTPLLSAPLRACHLTAHSVPHWLVLSITIYLLLEWQQTLHLTSLFHQLWIDYWM